MLFISFEDQSAHEPKQCLDQLNIERPKCSADKKRIQKNKQTKLKLIELTELSNKRYKNWRDDDRKRFVFTLCAKNKKKCQTKKSTTLIFTRLLVYFARTDFIYFVDFFFFLDFLSCVISCAVFMCRLADLMLLFLLPSISGYKARMLYSRVQHKTFSRSYRTELHVRARTQNADNFRCFNSFSTVHV